MKLMITGAAGQLGTELCRQLAAGKSALGPLPAAVAGAEAIPVDIADTDLTVRTAAHALMEWYHPDVVIHCAAYTAVDKAETEPQAAFNANALAARNVAMACERVGARLIHLSTDYVFNGESDRPYIEGDAPAPATVYGATKRMGEEYVMAFCSRWFIVRTAWLYGRTGANFVKTILRLAGERDKLRVVNDQRGNPTNAEDLAHHLLKLAATEEYGLYHCTGGGECSWYEFARAIVELSGKSARVSPCTSEEYKSAARRPANSSLAHHMLAAAVGDEMRPWREALEAFIQEKGVQA